jgi:MFS family permease
VLPLRFFKIRVVSATSAVSFLRGFVMITTLTMISIFVGTLTFGSADAVRNALYGLLIPMVIGASIGGVFLPRTGYRPMMTIGMLFMTFGALLLTLVSISTPTFIGMDGSTPTGLFLYLMPVGFGIGMTFAPAVLVVQYAVPRKDIGVSTSMVQFLMNIGGAFGVSILGSYESARVAALLPPGLTPNTLPYYAALPGPTAIAVHEVFVFMVLVAAIAIIPALFVKGVLPAKQPEGEVAPIAAA